MLVVRFSFSVDVSFPGDEGSFSSVAAGSCLREGRLLQLPRPRLCSPGVIHGFVLSDELSIGSMMLSKARTKCGREELVSMEALRLSELLAFGGVSPATSRDGEGQVDAEVTRAALMGRYPYTCRASLSRGPSDVVRFMQKLGQESRKEEEEDQEIGANKVFKKVREKSKIRNSLTKHGHSHYHDHDHEEEYDEKEPEWHSEPGGVTGTKVFQSVSSDYTKSIELEPLRDDEMMDTSDLMIRCLLHLSPILWSVTFDPGRFNLFTYSFIGNQEAHIQVFKFESSLSYLMFCFIDVIGCLLISFMDVWKKSTNPVGALKSSKRSKGKTTKHL
ncbi:hypothetical protein HID58_079157 [Brassica napus]|uniref:Uncharacterized protein n=1 Tax=Brassica napus TaxID=3708 RepID=A0ABQ7Y196_BRANA|nr:hypothetical protein HID58_079157 [Brassica napus]